MRPDSGIDQTSLAWLKPEIDASLARAGQALERHAEENFTGDGADEALAALHEVLGGLRMLELYGAALVAEEMEALVVALSKGAVQRVEDALTSLLRATLQLPDYLERLQSGYRDVPIVLLPLLNDLRSCRGEKLLSESVLLVPPTDPEPPAHLPRPAERLAAAELERRLAAIRRDWQFALLQWFRGQDNEAALARLADASSRILAAVTARPARQLWWVASSITGAMREHALDASISAKLLYGRLDREIKRLVDQGEVLYQQAPPTDLLRSLLYYAAQSGAGGATGEVQAAFQLGDLVRSDAEVDEARGALTGRNSSLLNSVVQALEEELLKVKDALDLYIRGDRADTGLLKAELEVLDRVADTLGMVGMGRERAEVQAQRGALSAMVESGHGGDQALLDIAGALIGVESSLQSHREHLGVAGEDAGSGERRRLAAAVVREAAVNLQQAKELFVAHLAGTAGNDHNVTSAMLLRDVAGALRVLEFEAASERALALAGFLHARDARAMPLTAEEINGFADALAGLEFYLELVADHQGHGEAGLERVTEALLRLGHWPPQLTLRDLFGPLATAMPAAAGAGTGAPAGTAVPAEAEAVPERIIDEVVEPAQPVAATASAGFEIAGREPFQALIDEAGFGFDADSAAGADAEIRDTFLEELSEEIGNLDAHLPGYVRNPDDAELLRTIRRSYHTIKGSGRMVGARVLGEFAWQIENLLNRVLAGKRPASASVMRVLENASATLPEFHAALCGDLRPRRDIAGIMAIAAALAEGEELMLPVDAMAPAQAERPAAPAPTPADDGVRAGSPEQASHVADAVAAGGDAIAAGKPESTPEAAAAGEDDQEAADIVVAPTPTPAPVATGATESLLDPVLLDILRSEVAGHIGVIDAYLHDARDNPALAAVPEHLLRAVHTLNGAFGAVELPAVTQLTAALEGYVRRLRALRRAPSAEGYEAIAAAGGSLAQVLDRLDAGEGLPDLVPLSQRLVAITDELQEVREDTAWLVGEPVPPVDQLLAEAEAEAEAEATAAADNAGLAATADALPPADAPPPPQTPAADDLGEGELERLIAAAEADEGMEFDFEIADQAPSPGSEDSDAAALEGAFLEGAGLAQAGDAAGSDEDQGAPAGSATPAGAGDEPAALREAVGPASPATAGQTPAVVPAVPFADDDWQALEGDERALLRALLDGQRPLPPGDVDPDLAELFREEAREILDRCEQHLARTGEIAPAELSQELARELHTLKGGARMAGFIEAGELGHAMESLLEAANNEQRDLDAEDLTLIGRCLDRLNGLVFGVAPAATQAPAEVEPETVAASPEPRQPADTAKAGDGTRRKPDHVDLHALTAGAIPAAEGAVTEFVRVRADQLDSLVNLAGEVGIIRTRLEQQVGSFRFSLEEFEQTVMRLREQLRKLEIEAETQILSREVRVQEQSGGSTGFDPLEMDRFSQLQQLSRALAESMSDLQSIQGLLDEHTRLAESLLLQQSRAGAELQEGLMRARMVPFESMLPRLRRLVRQEAEALGKKVRLSVEGAQGELDRGVLERMAAPFEHMLRNALVHGLESPPERRSAGKGEEGELRIRVAREATEVVIEVADDGRGIDAQRVRRTAIDRGLLSAESDLSDRDLYGFILEPGFSTAAELTQYAGRGVGMDVVASEIKQLGGSLAIDSTMGKGASFRVRLPYTLAVSQAVLVRVSDHTFAVPMVGVQGIVRLAYANYKERIREARPKVEYAGEDYEIYELDAVLGMQPSLLDDNAQVPLLMVRAGDLKVALRVDSLLGGREIVVKPVGPQLARIPGVFGATILGDGAVVVILDVSALLRRAAALRDRGDVLVPAAPVAPAARQRPLVLVVDDSITMRKVSARVLEREGYEVQTAKDGLDALEHVHERLPDVILLDLEMPRMDGYEFAGYMRNDPRFRAVPIIVITSRVGEKHRARAFEIGVNRYLGKPYQEADMLKAVSELLAEQTVN